jgi:hypothetical protein
MYSRVKFQIPILQVPTGVRVVETREGAGTFRFPRRSRTAAVSVTASRKHHKSSRRARSSQGCQGDGLGASFERHRGIMYVVLYVQSVGGPSFPHPCTPRLSVAEQALRRRMVKAGRASGTDTRCRAVGWRCTMQAISLVVAYGVCQKNFKLGCRLWAFCKCVMVLYVNSCA